MIDRTYRCDLCRDSYDVNSKELIGICWVGTATGDRIEKCLSHLSEHHICKSCLESLSQIAWYEYNPLVLAGH